MDISYVRKVQEWVELDNKILRSKEDMKDTYDRKKEVEDDIIRYVEENRFENLSLSISDGNIKFAKKTNIQPLSLKVLRQILEQYSIEGSDINVNDICSFVSKNLEKKNSISMKRDIR